MIYIKEDGVYLKYHADDDDRLICTCHDGTETVILNDISGEFDAVCDGDGGLHFVLQGTGGELIYLKRENGTWKKYSIFKSRNGLKKIHGLHLKKSNKNLCAFYIMEHNGNQLMVKHRFSSDNLYEEPEVLGITDARRDFCVCDTKTGEYHLFYKDADGNYHRKQLGSDFSVKASEKPGFESEILSLRCAEFNNSIYAVYTAPRKSSTALVFCNPKQHNSEKIITFGISRNCTPEIICTNDAIIIQWEEGGSIMYAESKDEGKTFTKPRPLGTGCVFARVRNNNCDDIRCDVCAVYNSRPYLGSTFGLRANNMSNDTYNKLTGAYMQNKNDIKNPENIKPVMNKLNTIQEDINKMGKSLLEICEFLNELKKFKEDTENNNFGFVNICETKRETPSGEDIGEIDENNIKLFENTDIDSVLPERKEGV